MALSKTSVFLAGRSQTTQLAVLVYRLANPVDLRVTSNGLVVGVDADHLEVLESGILGHPVGAENPQRFSDTASNSFFGDCLMVANGLELVNTMVLGLSVRGTLGDLLLSATTANSNAIDDKPLLGTEPKSSGLLGPGRARTSVDHIQLPVLPTAKSKKEEEDITLLLAPDFLHVFVGSHLG